MGYRIIRYNNNELETAFPVQYFAQYFPTIVADQLVDTTGNSHPIDLTRRACVAFNGDASLEIVDAGTTEPSGTFKVFMPTGGVASTQWFLYKHNATSGADYFLKLVSDGTVDFSGRNTAGTLTSFNNGDVSSYYDNAIHEWGFSITQEGADARVLITIDGNEITNRVASGFVFRSSAGKLEIGAALGALPVVGYKILESDYNGKKYNFADYIPESSPSGDPTFGDVNGSGEVATLVDSVNGVGGNLSYCDGADPSFENGYATNFDNPDKRFQKLTSGTGYAGTDSGDTGFTEHLKFDKNAGQHGKAPSGDAALIAKIGSDEFNFADIELNSDFESTVVNDQITDLKIAL